MHTGRKVQHVRLKLECCTHSKLRLICHQTLLQTLDDQTLNDHCLTVRVWIADSLQAELHQVTTANTALAAENMQIKHEMRHTVSAQMQLELSKQVCVHTHVAVLCAYLLPRTANVVMQMQWQLHLFALLSLHICSVQRSIRSQLLAGSYLCRVVTYFELHYPSNTHLTTRSCTPLLAC